MRGSLEGQTVGKYRVLEPLGRGGMARVYRGYHPQLDRFVAIKVLRPDLLDDEQFVQRFRREARAVASLRHPNIIQVHDFDVQDDLYYMVMELLDGDTLHKRLTDYRVRNQQMPWAEIVRIMADVLAGLGYAHSEGMIHRDIKPSNILLTKHGQVVLADFGIAQIIGGTQHTVTGALLGTLNYMAPEQGLKGKSDVRSDLYSLGIVFYEMLTRRPPFEAETPLAILMKHATDPLPLPREINPQIPPSFERVVLKVLSKDPADRYQTAEEMRQALLQAAADVEIEPAAQVSTPLSFNTPEDLSASVAVFSGTDRAHLQDASFADEQTAFTVAPNWDAQIAGLKAAEAISIPDTKLSPVPKDNKIDETTTILTGIGLPIAINLLAVFISGIFGIEGFFGTAWPLELFAIAAGLYYMMWRYRTIWFSIPASILLGTGYLLTYCNVTGNWSHWSFLWTVELFLIGYVVWRAIMIDHQPNRHSVSYEMGYQLFRISLISTAVVAIMGIFL